MNDHNVKSIKTSIIKEQDQEQADMIAAFIKENGVTDCPPGGVPGSEASKATERRVSELRREWRANKKSSPKA